MAVDVSSEFESSDDFGLRARLHGEFQPILPMPHPSGQSPIESHYKYNYKESVSAWIAEKKFQPGLGKPGSHITGLKISHVIVFSPA